MTHTGLTVGFIQPAVARGLIEHPSNIEKGLCQRFLWIAPKPNPTLFDELQCIDKDFTTAIGESCLPKTHSEAECVEGIFLILNPP